MATVSPGAAGIAAFAEAGAVVGRVAGGAGSVVQAARRRRRPNLPRAHFLKAIRNLANKDWPPVTAPTKIQWQDPFGPAAFRRDGGVSYQLHGWRHFVMAHFGEYYYRLNYIESSPYNMPNAVLITALDAIDWTARTATLSLNVHWYTGIEPCSAAEIYQVNPWRINSTRPFTFTRRLSTFTALVADQEDYQVPITFLWKVRPGQRLGIFVRMRSTGGHSTGEYAEEPRP